MSMWLDSIYLARHLEILASSFFFFSINTLISNHILGSMELHMPGPSEPVLKIYMLLPVLSSKKETVKRCLSAIKVKLVSLYFSIEIFIQMKWSEDYLFHRDGVHSLHKNKIKKIVAVGAGFGVVLLLLLLQLF